MALLRTREDVLSFSSGRALELGSLLDMEDDWMTRGACRHHPASTFFPSDGIGVEAACQICDTCSVKGPCLEYALRNRIVHGVWGGTSERQRRRISRLRRQAGASPVEEADRSSQPAPL
jgi:WhiB family redox-sensing transcriptional regulator